MSKRIDQLLVELKERKQRCKCGAVDYPECWMTKTQEQAIKKGLIEVCNDCSTETLRLVKVLDT